MSETEKESQSGSVEVKKEAEKMADAPAQETTIPVPAASTEAKKETERVPELSAPAQPEMKEKEEDQHKIQEGDKAALISEPDVTPLKTEESSSETLSTGISEMPDQASKEVSPSEDPPPADRKIKLEPRDHSESTDPSHVESEGDTVKSQEQTPPLSETKLENQTRKELPAVASDPPVANITSSGQSEAPKSEVLVGTKLHETKSEQISDCLGMKEATHVGEIHPSFKDNSADSATDSKHSIGATSGEQLSSADRTAVLAPASAPNPVPGLSAVPVSVPSSSSVPAAETTLTSNSVSSSATVLEPAPAPAHSNSSITPSANAQLPSAETENVQCNSSAPEIKEGELQQGSVAVTPQGVEEPMDVTKSGEQKTETAGAEVQPALPPVPAGIDSEQRQETKVDAVVEPSKAVHEIIAEQSNRVDRENLVPTVVPAEKTDAVVPHGDAATPVLQETKTEVPEEEGDDWEIPASDDEEQPAENVEGGDSVGRKPQAVKRGFWEPPVDVIVELYNKLDKEGVLDLVWKCPGRRPPSEEGDVEEEKEMMEDVEDEEAMEVSQEEDPTEFDFDIDTDSSVQKVTPRRALGSGQAQGSGKKRVARMDKVLNDIVRHRKIGAGKDAVASDTDQAQENADTSATLTPTRPLGKFHIRSGLDM